MKAMDCNQTTPATSAFPIRLSLDNLRWCNQKSGNRKLHIMILSWLVSVLFIVPAAKAAEVPGFDRAVVIDAREQPVGQFLMELFGQIDVPVRVSDTISGSVNGDFRKNARQVFNDIASSFQLSVYFDGAIAHIYPSNDVVHNILYMSRTKAQQIERTATKMGMADPHNNMSVAEVGLIVTGAPEFVDQLEEMSTAMGKSAASKITSPAPAPAPAATQDTYRTFQLRYAWANDVSLVIGGETVVVPGVASIISSLIEPGALQSPPVNGGYRTPGSSTLEGLRGQGLQSVNGQSNRNGEGASENAEPLSPRVAGNVKGDDGSTASTRIVADSLTNSVIIRDKANRMREYEALIESLDKEPKMIEIEATIIDLDTEKLRELGINWRLQRGDGEALLGDGSAADDLLRPNTDVTPRGDGGFISLVLGSRQQFIARIRALESQGAARIVSKPHVMTLSNVEALLDTTSTFFVRVEGQEEVDLFNVSVGTTLRVTPHVYEHGGHSQIKLRVNIEDGSTSDQSVDNIPIVENSTITTQAIIDVGQSLLIGGLVRETKSNGTDRVPVLGRIPLLGALFRSTTKTSTRNERMFLITPRVTNPGQAGKRFSAPILSGSEEAIIQSAPNRLFNSEQALNLRDEAYPLEQSLPRGDGLRNNETMYVEPFQSVPSYNESPSQKEPAGNPDQLDSLRDRLFKSQPQQQPQQQPQPQPQPQPNTNTNRSQPRVQRVDNDASPAGAPAVKTATDFMHDPDDGWQVITVSPAITSNKRDPALRTNGATPASVSRAIVSDTRQPLQSMTMGYDGWQVIK